MTVKEIINDKMATDQAIKAFDKVKEFLREELSSYHQKIISEISTIDLIMESYQSLAKDYRKLTMMAETDFIRSDLTEFSEDGQGRIRHYLLNNL